MKLTINKDILVRVIQNVNKAVATKSTIPILEYIKLELTNDLLKVVGTNMELGIEITIPRETKETINFTVFKEGSICLKAKYITDIIRKLSGDSIEIEVTNNYLTNIKSNNSEFNIHGLDSDEFPRLPKIKEENIFSIPSDLLRTMIRQTVVAVSSEETRPVLTGIKWTLVDGILTFVATDSHRLAMREVNVEVEKDYNFDNIIVPGKSLTELIKILEDNDVLVDIIISNNQLLLKIDNILFYSRLIEGQYPDVTRIIQQQAKTFLHIDKKQFLESLDRATLIARENKNNEVKMSIKENLVNISSNSTEIGKVEEQIIPINVTGDDLLIAYNARYVLDALRIIDEEEIEIQFTGAMSPFIIRQKDFEKYLYLVLPIRIY